MQDKSAKTVKIMHLENLLLYGMHTVNYEFCDEAQLVGYLGNITVHVQ